MWCVFAPLCLYQCVGTSAALRVPLRIQENGERELLVLSSMCFVLTHYAHNVTQKTSGQVSVPADLASEGNRYLVGISVRWEHSCAASLQVCVCVCVGVCVCIPIVCMWPKARPCMCLGMIYVGFAPADSTLAPLCILLIPPPFLLLSFSLTYCFTTVSPHLLNPPASRLSHCAS